MFSAAIWWISDFLIVLLIFRFWRSRLFTRYPYFSAYVVWVFVSMLIRASLQPVTSNAYAAGYWMTQFVSAFLAFGVTWEIYSQILMPYRGVRRMARAVTSIVLTIMLAKAAAQFYGLPTTGRIVNSLELEHTVRVIQALLLLAILGLIVHYRLPLGRNVAALMRGYGFYVMVIVVTLTLRVIAGKALPVVYTIQRIAWCITLGVWCVGMWSYSPNPTPNTPLECDYERISEQTTRALGQLRNHLIHSWRP